MPGLFGALSDGLDVERCLGAIRRVHKLHGLSCAEQVHLAEGCLFLSYTIDSDLHQYRGFGRVAGSDALLLLEGEVYNAKRGLSLSSSTCEATAVNLLLERYLERGPAFVSELDGEFNVVIYEPSHCRVRIFNDHIGSYPMYYCQSGKKLAFGSEKKFLFATDLAPKEIDPVGLLQPFVHRHNLDDRTFVESIKRLRPASILSCERGRLLVESYGGHLGGRRLPSSATELVEAWSHHLKEATAKRILGKRRLGISLSGGLDSRAIACSIDRAHRPIWARTMGVPNSREVMCAAGIAEALGLVHSVENISEYSLSSAVHRIVWRTEGETQFRDGLSVLTHKQTKTNCDHLIGGWLGDVSSGAHVRPFMMIPMGRQALIGKIFDWYVGYADVDFRSVFNADFLQRHMPSVRQAFFDSYCRYSDLPGTKAHEMWDLQNRQARMTISSMPVDSHLFGKVRPFFDRTYLDFAMSVPQRWRVGQNLYKSLIHAIGPEIRRIPNGNDNALLRASPIANLSAFFGSAGPSVMRKARSRLHLGGGGEVAQVDGLGFALQTRRDVGLRAIVDEFVNSGSFDDSIFSRPGILATLDQHYSGERDYSGLIGVLVTWVIALQYFVYGDVKSCPAQAQPQLL